MKLDLPGQTGNVQFLQRGLSPIKTLAMEDFPAPVAPTMTMCGKGRSKGGSSGVPKYETTLK